MIKSNSKGIYVTKDFHFKFMQLFWALPQKILWDEMNHKEFWMYHGFHKSIIILYYIIRNVSWAANQHIII